MNYNKLTSQEEKVIVYKGTEPPFTGKYDHFNNEGTFICRRCNAPLSHQKANLMQDVDGQALMIACQMQ